MTRKDYEKFARLIHDTKFSGEGVTADANKLIFVLDFMEILEADNPLFDASRFMEACIESHLLPIGYTNSRGVSS